MTFNLKTTLNVSADNSIQLIQGLTKTNLLIEISGNDTFVSGSRIERSFKKGYVFRLRWLQNGLRGGLVSASYGIEDFIFNIPNPLEPFDIEIIPNRYQFTYVVKVFEKVFNPSYANLTEKLGIPLEVLERIPENTLILLESINLMASTDTRTTLAAIEAAALKAEQALTVGQGAQTKADLTANSLIEAKTEMVLDRRFELTQAMFTLENGFMVADVTHDLTAGKPDMSVTDSQGDDQGFAQLVAKSPTVARVELSLQQHTDNSYPLTFLLQGSKGIASLAIFLLIAGNLSSSVDGGVTLTSLATLVEYAYMLNGNIRYKRQDQSCFSYNIATGETTSDEIGDFNTDAGNPLTVVIA